MTADELGVHSHIDLSNGTITVRTPNKTNKVECEHSKCMDVHIYHSKNMLPEIQIQKTYVFDNFL